MPGSKRTQADFYSLVKKGAVRGAPVRLADFVYFAAGVKGGPVVLYHVADGLQEGGPDQLQQKVALREMLIRYRPGFHILEQTDYMVAVDRIVAEQDIDMIWTLPRTHRFFAIFLVQTIPKSWLIKAPYRLLPYTDNCIGDG